MREWLQAVLLVVGLGLCSIGQAQTPAFSLDGEAFTKKFVGKPFQGDKLIEFVRPDETFRDWGKLIRIRYQQAPRIDNDPKKFVAALVKSLLAKNPNLWHELKADDQREEVTLDYLVVDGDQLEYNVLRFQRSYDARAVVSLQLAYRSTEPNPPSREALARLRESWLAQVAMISLHQVHMTIER